MSDTPRARVVMPAPGYTFVIHDFVVVLQLRRLQQLVIDSLPPSELFAPVDAPSLAGATVTSTY